MICPTYFNQKSVFYPFGNTTAVSLTQDLPPEQDADILLLGCGDVRNILFTCFADVTRKIDATCCDIEPLIHARNILLYSLLIDDPTNRNFECIWSIYYDWKLDKESLELLETQVQKLLRVSESIDQWHDSTYGSSIRFCDVKSLSCVRSYWLDFRSHSEKFSEMQAAINRAKAWRDKHPEKESITLFGLYPAYPIGFAAMEDLTEIANHWWDCGTLPSSRVPTPKSNNLNPALLYSPNPSLTIGCAIHPLLGIPVCTAFTPISKGSAFHLEQKDASTAEYMVDCAKSIFRKWTSAFRTALANKSVIRIFCGDALALCFMLRSYQLKLLASAKLENLPCDDSPTSSPQLHHGDYGNDKNAAPLSFDIIDTSNLVDVLGPLNVIPITSSLLKNHASSTLYTEVLIQRDSSLINRMNNFFGVDVQTMSLSLGLVEPDLFTNAIDSVDEDPLVSEHKHENEGQSFDRSRLRWRRLQGCMKSGNMANIHIEANELARFLIGVHNSMFKHEDLFSLSNRFDSSSASSKLIFSQACITQYNRASFASLLSFIKATIDTDWDQCVTHLYDTILSADPYKSMTPLHSEDLLLNMHLYGVDNGRFEKPAPADVKAALFASYLPWKDNLPEQLCITTRVPRKQLGIYARKTSNKMGSPTITCTIEGEDFSETWFHTFSTVQMKFGSWHEQTKGTDVYPYIVEDIAQQSGSSDMFVSVMVPTKVLLQSKLSIPWVRCELVPTFQSLRIFTPEFGDQLWFARNKMTSKDVFITRYMPGMSTLPVYAHANAQKDKPTSTTITVRLKDNDPKINTCIQRINLESQTAKTVLANPSSTVEIKFKSPMAAVVSIGQSETLNIKFAVPVSATKYKIRIARKSSYIEIETPLFDPLSENAAFFLFPTCMTKTPCGTTVPTLWTSTRINLDAMPSMDLTDKYATSWLAAHTFLMFSNREVSIRSSNMKNPSLSRNEIDIRTDLKDGVFSIFMHYAGLKCQEAEFFALTKPNGVIQTLIFPSRLRLNLVNQTVVLDTAIIPLTKSVRSDPRVAKFIQELTSHDFCEVQVSEAENQAWKAMMPALVERCRTKETWKHTFDCEYVKTGEIPLLTELTEDNASPICSCGVGKFPSGDFLPSQVKKLPDVNYMLSHYATRAAIAPIFPVSYIEDCCLKDLSKLFDSSRPVSLDELSATTKSFGIARAAYNEAKCVMKEKCVKCGRSERVNVETGKERLLRCSRCKLVRYCSTECQAADWKKHKSFCAANRQMMPFGHNGNGDVYFVPFRY